MKNFIPSVYTLCVISFLLFILSSCDCNKKEDSLTFSFDLMCSEELLDFMVPTATYIDENNDKQVVVLSKSSFSKVTNNNDSVGQYSTIFYSWKKMIKLTNTHTGQRDMNVSYKIREDAPQIDNEKIYDMSRSLSCSHSQTYNEVGRVDLSINLDMNIIVDKIKGDKLQAYLEELEKNSDYIKKEVK